jgi:hypothetical protein
MAQSVDSIIISIDEFNKDVSSWAYRNRSLLKSQARAMSTNGNGTLSSSIRTSTRKQMGEIDSISYKFPRHGVFFQKGVGRGHVMSGNRVVRGIKNGKVIQFTDGPVNRQPKNWFNATLETEIPKLADIVADHKADEAAVNAAGMRIS